MSEGEQRASLVKDEGNEGKRKVEAGKNRRKKGKVDEGVKRRCRGEVEKQTHNPGVHEIERSVRIRRMKDGIWTDSRCDELREQLNQRGEDIERRKTYRSM